MLKFLVTTENIRKIRSEQPNYNRGKVLEKSSGKLLFAISRYKSNESRAVQSDIGDRTNTRAEQESTGPE